MTDESPFALPGKDVALLLERLRALGTLAPETPETQQRIYYDTFDWRLFAAGLVLWRQGQGRGARLVLASRINEDTELSAPMPKMVRFARGLQNQALRRRLQPVLEMRALMPVAEVTIQRRGYRLLNDDGKTVVRVAVDYPVVHTDQDALVSLAARFHLFGVRGYEDTLVEARSGLGDESFEAAPGADLLVEALRSIGREAGGYSSKLDIPLDPEMPADAATRRILDHLMSTLTANIEGTKADLDSEFLHDLRVAVRRTRSALSQVKQVFDAAFTQKYADEFRWVGEITGP
ncbi:MAG: CHAD domain-containing protein, partial [Pseudomonadota bacterium]